MPTISSILSDINNLSNYEKEILLNAIENILVFGSYAFEIESDVKEQHFSKGRDLLLHSPTIHTTTKVVDFKDRKAIFI